MTDGLKPAESRNTPARKLLFGSEHRMPELVELPEHSRNKFHQFRQCDVVVELSPM